MTKRAVKTDTIMSSANNDSEENNPILSADGKSLTVKKIGILSDDPMSEAGRKALSFFFAQMRDAEVLVREGGHKDAIHDMRVATRRLRSTMDIFDPYFRSHTLKPYQKGLRSVARELGAVRDIEVVKAKTEKQAGKMGGEILEAMQPVISSWESDYSAHYTTLLHTLDTANHQSLMTEFAAFLSTPMQGARQLNEEAPEPYFVRHAAPLLIAQRYAELRAYEPILKNASLDTLHELRIAAKQFRYIVETFAEVLEPDAKLVIDETKALQDHLGSLQDERVIVELVHSYVSHAGETQPLSGVLRFLAAREEEKLRLWNAIPKVWEKFTRREVRQALALSLAEL